MSDNPLDVLQWIKDYSENRQGRCAVKHFLRDDETWRVELRQEPDYTAGMDELHKHRQITRECVIKELERLRSAMPYMALASNDKEELNRRIWEFVSNRIKDLKGDE